jgi:hypothetical protein
MTTLADGTAVTGGALRPVLAATARVLALGTALGTFTGIRHWRPGITEHDRFGVALVAGLLIGVLLAILAALTVPRPLRRPYLLLVGVGLLPSFAAAGLVALRTNLLLDDGSTIPAVTGLVVGAVLGGLAGSDLGTRNLMRPAVPATLGVLAGLGAMILWAEAALYQ